MSKAKDEFNKLMERAGVCVYRKYGHIRASMASRLTEERQQKVINAIKQFSPRMCLWWKWPEPDTLEQWKSRKYTSIYVCDDPIPFNVDPSKEDAHWILRQCRRYDFDIKLIDGKLKSVALIGHDIDVIKQHLPKWFIELVKTRQDDIVKALVEIQQFNS